jgi:hypothetical protein
MGLENGIKRFVDVLYKGDELPLVQTKYGMFKVLRQ